MKVMQPTAAERLSLSVAAGLMRVPLSTLQRHCRLGRISACKEGGNGGSRYTIAVDQLPSDARHRYLAQQLKAEHPPADRRAALQRLNLEEQTEREVARAAGITRKRRPMPHPPLTVEESLARRLAFEKLCEGAQQEAHHRAAVMQHFTQLDLSQPKMERYRLAADAAGESTASLRRWHSAVKNLAFRDWAPALAPAWGKGRPKIGLSKEAMQFIVREWGCQSQPSLGPIYRRAKKEAERQGWVLPSYKTVLRRINAIPAPQRAWLREGDKGIDRFVPPLKRDYSKLRLHEIWCSDGRKADVFCVWPDGDIGRPILLAWQELKTRKVLGWAIGRTESAELARTAFGAAAKRSNAVPEFAYLDNGRAYASKALTGGQATRNRFKISADDPIGVLTLFGVEVIWATPYNGRAKPIESFWNTIAEAERCAAFAGSWCGNRPEAKPEEFDGKPIPIGAYISLVRETIDEKNALPHRGDSMDGRSPNELYAELIATSPVNAPTARDLHMCLAAVERVTLDRKSLSVMVHGNRYWCEEVARLDHRGPYQARYNPDDLSEPIALYDRAKFICEVPLWREGEFRNQAAAKDYARAKRGFKRAERDSAVALQAMERSRRSWEQDTPTMPSIVSGDGPKSPAAKVVRMRRPALELPVDRSSLRSTAQREQEQAQFNDDLAMGLRLRVERRRANGGE